MLLRHQRWPTIGLQVIIPLLVISELSFQLSAKPWRASSRFECRDHQVTSVVNRRALCTGGRQSPVAIKSNFFPLLPFRSLPLLLTHLQGDCGQKQVSFMWKIKRRPPSYFFGTIHVPYTRVWDSIPVAIKEAFEASDCVFFELDLLDPYTVSTLASCQVLPHGKKLMEVLPPDMYRRLKRHLDYVRVMLPNWMTTDQRGRGLYAEYLFNAITGNWERKRPIWVMLMVNSLTESDIKSRGIPVLDLYLAQEAQRMNKRTGAVEKVEEQCVPLNGLNGTQVLFALNRTLSQHENIRRGFLTSPLSTDDLIKHYNCGDLNAVIFNQDTTQVPALLKNPLSQTRQELAFARRIDDYFRSELILKRNKRMGQRVLQLLNSHPDQSFFFAFGAGHFLGNNSILDFVEEGGFEVVSVGQSKGRSERGEDGIVSQMRSQRKRGCSFGANATPPPKGPILQMEEHKGFERNQGRTGSTGEQGNNQSNNQRNGSASFREKQQRSKSRSKATSSSISAERVDHQEHNNLHSDSGYRGWSSSQANDLAAFVNPSTRSTTTATTTSFSPHSPHYSWGKKGFNDLWVRLETVTQRMPHEIIPTREELSHSNDVQAVKNYLRDWYGLPSAAPQTPLSSPLLLLLLLLSLCLSLIHIHFPANSLITVFYIHF